MNEKGISNTAHFMPGSNRMSCQALLMLSAQSYLPLRQDIFSFWSPVEAFAKCSQALGGSLHLVVGVIL